MVHWPLGPAEQINPNPNPNHPHHHHRYNPPHSPLPLSLCLRIPTNPSLPTRFVQYCTLCLELDAASDTSGVAGP